MRCTERSGPAPESGDSGGFANRPRPLGGESGVAVFHNERRGSLREQARTSASSHLRSYRVPGETSFFPATIIAQVLNTTQSPKILMNGTFLDGGISAPKTLSISGHQRSRSGQNRPHEPKMPLIHYDEAARSESQRRGTQTCQNNRTSKHHHLFESACLQKAGRDNRKAIL